LPLLEGRDSVYRIQPNPHVQMKTSHIRIVAQKQRERDVNATPFQAVVVSAASQKAHFLIIVLYLS